MIALGARTQTIALHLTEFSQEDQTAAGMSYEPGYKKQWGLAPLSLRPLQVQVLISP